MSPPPWHPACFPVSTPRSGCIVLPWHRCLWHSKYPTLRLSPIPPSPRLLHSDLPMRPRHLPKTMTRASTPSHLPAAPPGSLSQSDLEVRTGRQAGWSRTPQGPLCPWHVSHQGCLQVRAEDTIGLFTCVNTQLAQVGTAMTLYGMKGKTPTQQPAAHLPLRAPSPPSLSRAVSRGQRPRPQKNIDSTCECP